eukprot:Opistho-1_new@81055
MAAREDSSMRRSAMISMLNLPQTHEVVAQHNVLNDDEFGINTFNDRVMRAKLPKETYKALHAVIKNGTSMDTRLADIVANAMREWASEKGATHFCHWFQPLTGKTAEKHDSFIEFSGEALLLEFSGKQLIKGETDGSSFPSGGLRSTFEARGYTLWDPSSPAFIREGAYGKTLCIPTAFCSWGGEALDTKTPLLRSVAALQRETVPLLHLLGFNDVVNIHTNVGAEQEFFLIDRHFFFARPDLVACGRTLQGADPAKGQALQDHYFGSIQSRILAFLQESELILWKLGVPMKTRHYEVAPAQYEMAPIFEKVNIAVDHNMLVMQVMTEVALRHGLVCILHEKPFANLNGSGKHNNWSVGAMHANGDVSNLFEIHRRTEHNAVRLNERFLVFLAATIRAVDMHADLLRISVSSNGQDLRLGGHEAPPAIMSVYLGKELDAMCRAIISGVDARSHIVNQQEALDMGVAFLPELPKDTIDRNRTSPFAFTSNKFEFRAAGASQSLAFVNTVLNTAFADSCAHIRSQIEARMKTASLEAAVTSVVRETLTKHYRVVYNGDNYSHEWVKEAEGRGLLNLRTSPEALRLFDAPKNVELFERLSVLSPNELQMWKVVAFETFDSMARIEGACLLDIARTIVLPAAMEHQRRMCKSVAAIRAIASQADGSSLKAAVDRQQHECTRTATLIAELLATSQTLESTISTFGGNNGKDLAQYSALATAMAAVRNACDTLETVVDDALWQLPMYSALI